MTHKTRLHNILHLVSAADTQHRAHYQQVIALPGGRGITRKAAQRSGDLEPQTCVRAGQFMIAKRHLNRGLWGVVPPECDGALASHAYYVFELSADVNPDYFSAYLTTPPIWASGS